MIAFHHESIRNILFDGLPGWFDQTGLCSIRVLAYARSRCRHVCRRPRFRTAMIAILSSSLNSDSNSRLLAHEAQRVLERDGQAVTLLDLREYPLPLCDGEASYADPNVVRLGKILHTAHAIIVATPIYNYDGTAAVKNVIELTGPAWEDKVVGFLCAAAGASSYMSIMSFANSLMLDFRSVIVPRFVYATGGAFADGAIRDPEQVRRVAELAREAARLGTLLRAA